MSWDSALWKSERQRTCEMVSSLMGTSLSMPCVGYNKGEFHGYRQTWGVDNVRA